MSDISMPVREALELRYDGPIPPQHLETERTQRRRRRGTLAVFEAQAAQFLDAAERCLNDAEDLAAQLGEHRFAPWQQQLQERRLGNLVARADAHVRAAAEAMAHAQPLRSELGLPPHPLTSLSGLLGRQNSAQGAEGSQ